MSLPLTNIPARFDDLKGTLTAQVATVASISALPAASAANLGLTLNVAGNPTTRWHVATIGTGRYLWVQI